MKTTTQLLVAILVMAETVLATAQSNPGSTNATDVELQLAWPDGVAYINGLNDVFQTSGIGQSGSGGWAGVTVDTILSQNWAETVGGTGEEKTTYSPNQYVSSWDYQYFWGPSRWPEFSNGYEQDLPGGNTNAWATPNYTDWNINGTSTYYGSYNYSSPDGSSSIQINSQGQVALVTGGEPGSTDMELFSISCSAVAWIFSDQPWPSWNFSGVAPGQIQIGNFGVLPPSGTLYAVLPAHKELSITPKVAAIGAIWAGPSVQPYPFISQCYATTPTNRSRTTLGVGEQVALYFGSTLPTNALWSTTAGGLKFASGSTNLFTAPSNAATATITVQVFGKSVSKTFKVVEPSGIDHAVIAATNNILAFPNLTNGQAGAEMLLNIYFAPTEVSFYRVNIMEVGEDGSNITGYFSQWTPQQLHHTSADHWTTLNQANEMNDTCAELDPSPWSSGGFTWDIPSRWQVDGSGATNFLNGWNQVFSIDGSGTVTIVKDNHWVQRTTNGVITTK